MQGIGSAWTFDMADGAEGGSSSYVPKLDLSSCQVHTDHVNVAVTALCQRYVILHVLLGCSADYN